MFNPTAFDSSSKRSRISTNSTSTPQSTITLVPSESPKIETPDKSPRPSLLSLFSSSPGSSSPNSTTSSPAPSLPPLARQNSIGMPGSLVRTISSEFGTTVAYENRMASKEEGAASAHNQSLSTRLSPSPTEDPAQWSSAVGYAATGGKTGHVIERLMQDNDMLKRERNIERLRVEESKNTAQMAVAKMEIIQGEFDSVMHDAAVAKTLLKRSERKLAEFKSQLDGEKQKSQMAVESERNWRAETERIKEESTRELQQIKEHVALLEHQNSHMASHWKDEKAKVEGQAVKTLEDIREVLAVRREDQKKIERLETICAQKDREIACQREYNENLNAKHEEYKKFKEDSLTKITRTALQAEKKSEEYLQEVKNLMGQLKWALNIKKNVKDAN